MMFDEARTQLTRENPHLLKKATFGEKLIGFPLGIIGVVAFSAVEQAVTYAFKAGVHGFMSLMLLKVSGLPLYIVLTIGFACILGMIIVYYLRDWLNWASIAMLQVVVSAAICVAVVLSGLNSFLPILSLLGSIFTGANGVKRLIEILNARSG